MRSIFALVLVMALAACGSPSSTGIDAAADGPVGGGPDGGGPKPDAATELVTSPGNAFSPTPCDSVCAEYSWTCTPECPSAGGVGIVAGTKIYMDMGSFKTLDIATCAEAVPTTFTEFGTNYALDQYSCCCRAPAVQHIDGDVTMLQDCDAVCSAHGLKCEPNTDFGIYGSGGVLLKYNSSKGGGVFETGNCAKTPTPTGNNAPPGETWTLFAYTCGCR